MPGILAERDDEVAGPHRLKLVRQPFNIEFVNQPVPFAHRHASASQVVNENAPACLMHPFRAIFRRRAVSRKAKNGKSQEQCGTCLFAFHYGSPVILDYLFE